MPKSSGKENVLNVPVVTWDTGDMSTLCGTLAGITVSREEISLLFSSRSFRTADSCETIVVGDRIIMNPYTAKRMLLVLQRILARHQAPSGAEHDGPRAFRDASEREPF